MRKGKRCFKYILPMKRSKVVWQDYGWKSFNSSVQQKLADLEESNEADQLTNCEVFKSKHGEQMEVLVPKNRFSKYQLYFFLCNSECEASQAL